MKICRKLIITLPLAFIFVGCATNQPTSKVIISNGKYTKQTTVPNNNKGKKVRLNQGQSYHCVLAKDHKFSTLDASVSKNGSSITVSSLKVQGKLDPKVYRFVFNPNTKDFSNGNDRLTIGMHGELGLSTREQLKNREGYQYQCTQTTNNTYTSVVPMSKDEIDMWKHGNQINAINAQTNALEKSAAAQEDQAFYQQQIANQYQINTIRANRVRMIY